MDRRRRTVDQEPGIRGNALDPTAAADPTTAPTAALMVPARAPARAPTQVDFDTTAEVDATFRTQRRVALGYFGVFLAVTLAVPTLTLVLDWWSEGRIAGMSPNFLMAAGGLYLVFFMVTLAAGSLADAVEDRMLGGGDEHLGALPALGEPDAPLPTAAPADQLHAAWVHETGR